MFIPEQAVMVKKAFTLIEVLVVVMIIGIISLGVFFGTAAKQVLVCWTLRASRT